METITPDHDRHRRHRDRLPERPAARRSLLLVGGLVFVAAALGAACSDHDDGPDLAETQSIDTTDADDSSGSGSDDPQDEDAASDSPASSSGSGEILGTTRASMRASVIDNRSTPLRLDVTRLERVGDLVELTMVLTNEAEAPTDDSDPQNFQADVIFAGTGYGGNARYDASGIGLVDADSQQMYLPVIDSDDVCLCTGNFNNEEVPPGGTMTITATFGGVPEDLSVVDLYIPQFPTISGLEVQ